MTPVHKQAERILKQWAGEDAAGHSSPDAVAKRIDEEYQRYIASLRSVTAAIVAGTKANERRVA